MQAAAAFLQTEKGSPQGTAFLRNINIRGDLIYFFFLAMTTAAPLRRARANAPPATPVDGFVFEAFEAAFELLSDLLSEELPHPVAIVATIVAARIKLITFFFISEKPPFLYS